MRVFYVGRCVLRERVVRGSGLDEYFGEQGLPLGIPECLERCVMKSPLKVSHDGMSCEITKLM